MGETVRWAQKLPQNILTLNRPGGGIRSQAGSSLCCAKTVSSGKLKLCDFYYILIIKLQFISTVAMVTLLLKSAWYNFG